jgi:hypothetical protein
VTNVASLSDNLVAIYWQIVLSHPTGWCRAILSTTLSSDPFCCNSAVEHPRCSCPYNAVVVLNGPEYIQLVPPPPPLSALGPQFSLRDSYVPVISFATDDRTYAACFLCLQMESVSDFSADDIATNSISDAGSTGSILFSVSPFLHEEWLRSWTSNIPEDSHTPQVNAEASSLLAVA